MANRKITNLKVLEGNRGKRPLPKDEPKPQPVAPDLPKDIDTQAKKAWQRLAPMAVRLGLLTETDGDSFASLCQARSRLLQIWTRLKKIPKELKAAEREVKKIKMEVKNLTSKNDKQDPYQDQDLGALFVEISDLQAERAFWMKEERLYFQVFRMLANDFGFSPRGRVGLVVATKNPEGKGKDLLS